MDYYIRNKVCPCVRCKMNDMMGPAILVTIGTMLLLHNVTYFVRSATVIAVLLIVIGGLKLLQSSASTDGHVQPGTLPHGAIPPVPPAPPSNAPSTGSTSEVHNV